MATLNTPALTKPEQEDFPLENGKQVEGSGEVIVVVEYDHSTWEALQVMLEVYKYQVLTAENGVEALGVHDRCGRDIALVVSNLVMLERGGGGLYNALRERWPEAKVLFVIGLSLFYFKERRSSVARGGECGMDAEADFGQRILSGGEEVGRRRLVPDSNSLITRNSWPAACSPNLLTCFPGDVKS